MCVAGERGCHIGCRTGCRTMTRRWTVLECVAIVQALLVFLLVAYFFWSRSTPGLITALRMGDSSLRASAASMLGARGPAARSAIPALEEALRSPDELVQSRAAAALGEIGGIDVLAENLKSPNEQVRTRVIMALRSLNLQDPEQRQRRVAMYIAGLNDSAPKVREWAAGGLGESKEDVSEALPYLKELLHDQEWGVKRTAAQTIASIGSLEDVRAMLDSEDVRVRNVALSGLAKFGIDAIPALISALQDPDQGIVIGAEGALGHMGKEAHAAVPALANTLNHPDRWARAQAVYNLELVGGTDAIPALRGAVNDPDPTVRNWAKQALARLEGQTK